MLPKSSQHGGKHNANTFKKCMPPKASNKQKRLMENMNNYKTGKVDFGTDRRTAVQIEGSRGLVSERGLHQTIEGNP